jgi:hypothetical protein
MARHVRGRKLATDDEIAEITPRKSDRLIEWIKAYGWFRAWVYSEYTGDSGRDRAEREVIAALNEEPELVRLTDGTEVRVYPKGMRALLWYSERDWLVEYLNDQLDLLRAIAEHGAEHLPKRLDIVSMSERIMDEIARQVGYCARVATTPGPAMPTTIEPWDDLSPIDAVFIATAFARVNGSRVQFLSKVARKRKGDSVAWSVFMGSMSQKTGTSAADLMDSRSLAALLSEAYLAMPDMDDLTNG